MNKHLPYLALLTLLSSLLLPAKTLAASDIPTITLKPVIGFTNLSQAINTLITALIFFGAIITFVFIVIGAFKYVTAGDNAAAVTQARATIQNAVIGLIILGLVFVLFTLVTKLIPGLSGVFSFQ